MTNVTVFAATAALMALTAFWVWKNVLQVYVFNPIGKCCHENKLRRYPVGFEICPQSRDLFSTLCAHRSYHERAFDAGMTQLQRILSLKRDLIMLTRKAETQRQKDDCVNKTAAAKEAGLTSIKEFLTKLMDDEVATWESVNNVMKFAAEVFTKHVDDVHRFCGAKD